MINVLIHPNLDKIVAAARRCLVLTGDRTIKYQLILSLISANQKALIATQKLPSVFPAPVAGGGEYRLVTTWRGDLCPSDIIIVNN